MVNVKFTPFIRSHDLINFSENFTALVINNGNLQEFLNIFDELKENNERVIFVSGHFNNFELMAMQIEKSGINLAAIYRPLNNKFLN